MLSRLSVFAAAAVLSVGMAQAAPLSLAGPAPIATPLVDTGASALLVPVRAGCGFGEHRGFYGGCRINHGWRGHLRAAETGLPHGCPPGLHRGFRGRCI